MSITVHFGGKLASVEDLDTLLSFINYYAQEKDWISSELKEDDTVKLQPWEKGISLISDMRIDPIHIYFDETLTLETFCKTQFGGVEAHVEVIEFLHAIEDFFLNFWVDDEGEYWTTSDEFLLEHKLDMVAKILDDVEKPIEEQKDENKWKYN